MKQNEDHNSEKEIKKIDFGQSHEIEHSDLEEVIRKLKESTQNSKKTED